MVPKSVLELVCIPVAVIAVTLYVVVIGIDTAAQSAFGKVWRDKVGNM
jgi:hypothetical protein